MSNSISVVTKVPISDGLIVNPITGRLISVKGRVFKELVNKNILKIDQEDTGSVVYKGKTIEECKNVKANLNVVDDKHTTHIKNNKIFKRRKNVNKTLLKEKISEVAIEVYKENAHLFSSGMPESQIQSLLQNLINQKLADPNANISTTLKDNFNFIVDHMDEVEEKEILEDLTEEDSEDESEEEQEDEEKEELP